VSQGASYPRPVLLGSTCAGCGAHGAVVCRACAAALEPAPALPPPLDVDGWSALLRYDDGARALLTGLKNHHRRDLVGWLADGLVAALPPPPPALVTWAPTGRARRQARGFDQAELLARALARRWHLPCRGLLVRRSGQPQAGRRAAERRSHPGFRTRRSAPSAVLVVDDVATTGATLTAAARALRGAGAEQVRAVVGARAVPRSGQ
jgi:predicted amidophosphoribosyltransferase